MKLSLNLIFWLIVSRFVELLHFFLSFFLFRCETRRRELTGQFPKESEEGVDKENELGNAEKGKGKERKLEQMDGNRAEHGRRCRRVERVERVLDQGKWFSQSSTNLEIQRGKVMGVLNSAFYSKMNMEGGSSGRRTGGEKNGMEEKLSPVWSLWWWRRGGSPVLALSYAEIEMRKVENELRMTKAPININFHQPHAGIRAVAIVIKSGSRLDLLYDWNHIGSRGHRLVGSRLNYSLWSVNLGLSLRHDLWTLLWGPIPTPLHFQLGHLVAGA